jgi:hypothetical protein
MGAGSRSDAIANGACGQDRRSPSFSVHHQSMSLPTSSFQPAPARTSSAVPVDAALDVGSDTTESVVSEVLIPAHHLDARTLITSLQSRPDIVGLAPITSVRQVGDVLVIEQRIPRGACSNGESISSGASMPDPVAVIAHLARTLATCHDAGVVHGAVTASNVRVYPSGRVELVGVGIDRQASDDVYDLARLAWEWWEQGSVDAKTAGVLVRAHDEDPRLRPSMAQVSAALADALRRCASVLSPPATRGGDQGRQHDSEHVAARGIPGVRLAKDCSNASTDERFTVLRAQINPDSGRGVRKVHKRSRRRHAVRNHAHRLDRTEPAGLPRWVAGSTRRGVLRGSVIALGSSLATLIIVSGLLP